MSCVDPFRSTELLPRLRDLALGGFLRRVRVIRTGVHFQLAVHRLAHLRFGEHAVYRVFDQLFRFALPHEARAFLAKAAFIPAVLTVDLLIFLAARELHLRGVDDDDMVPGVDERGVLSLVLALEPALGRTRATDRRFRRLPPVFGTRACGRGLVFALRSFELASTRKLSCLV